MGSFVGGFSIARRDASHKKKLLSHIQRSDVQPSRPTQKCCLGPAAQTIYGKRLLTRGLRWRRISALARANWIARRLPEFCQDGPESLAITGVCQIRSKLCCIYCAVSNAHSRTAAYNDAQRLSRSGGDCVAKLGLTVLSHPSR